MNTSEVERSPKSLQCYQNCKVYLAQLESELEATLAEQKAIANPKECSKLNVSVNDLKNKIEQVNRMLEFPPGSWVRNGSKKPGKVIDLVIAGKVPEVHVQWSGTNVPVPEQPLKLKLVEPADLEYIWNGDRFPKLVRRIDCQECNEIPVLQENLNRLQICQNISVEHGNDEGSSSEVSSQRASPHAACEARRDLVRGYQLQLTYCKKRIEYLKRPYRDRVLISMIRRDGGTQQRVNLNHEVVSEYAEAMRSGAEFPPVRLRYDGENYWLTDGFHTTEAAWSIGKKIIEAEITWGNQRDAILDSVGANASHGLRRSNADKRKAVTAMLEDNEWQNWSNREIARCCSVTEGLVRKIKKELQLVHLNGCVQYAPNSNEVVQANGCVQYAPDESTDKLTNFTDNKVNSADNQDSKTSNQDSSCPDSNDKPDSSCPEAESNIQIGDFVKISPASGRPDKNLIGLAGKIAVVIAKHESTYDLQAFSQKYLVHKNDLEPLGSLDVPKVCTSSSIENMRFIYTHFDSHEDVLKAAIAARSLKI